jgi:hypothetical protein
MKFSVMNGISVLMFANIFLMKRFAEREDAKDRLED